MRTDGPFVLRSGRTSSWYLDARQTTYSGAGATAVGAAMLGHIPLGASAVGGMTMGADPIAVATAIAATAEGRSLDSFSIRKEAKDHGTGGRLVGPVQAGDAVAVVEDTTTTGSALAEAIAALRAEAVEVLTAVALVDRSGGRAARTMADLGVPYVALIEPDDLGMEGD
ncbi:MAG: orotate phosphoribosyltransferase [Acidimicrobiia bacterium]|nr:orotate phosphoribosyltransferase [Acidimicrobiia bacterium]